MLVCIGLEHCCKYELIRKTQQTTGLELILAQAKLMLDYSL